MAGCEVGAACGCGRPPVIATGAIRQCLCADLNADFSHVRIVISISEISTLFRFHFFSSLFVAVAGEQNAHVLLLGGVQLVAGAVPINT